jgi:hypothetical protein
MSIIAKLLGWIGVPQWALELAVIALVAAGAAYEYHHILDKGRQQELAVVAAQAAADTAKLQRKADAAEHTHDQELTDLRSFRDAHPVEPVRLCGPAPVRAPGAVVAGNSGSGAAPAAVQSVPAGDTGVRQWTAGRDIGPMLEALAARADSVSSQLRVYQEVH